MPFEFDIHGVITAENAPELEYLLHRHFLAQRWNKKNFGKEFFRIALKDIRQTVEKLAQDKNFADKVTWWETEAGRAAEWQQSQEIENNSQAKQEWLKREEADADKRWRKRERRLATNHRDLGLSAPSDLNNGEAGEDKPES